MKKLLVILGVISLGLVVLVGALIGYAAFTGGKLDSSSKAYVDANLPPIISGWSEIELRRRASPEFLRATPAGLDRLFSKLKQLGPLKRYEGSRGGSRISLTTQNGKVVSAGYVASAVFQNGSARIRVGLIREGGQWRILSFYVDSPIFSK